MAGLLYQDLRSEVPPPQRGEFDDLWNADIQKPPDDSVLDMLVQIGNARDREDALQVWSHQQQMANIADPMERAKKTAQFNQKRAAEYADSDGQEEEE